MWANDSLWFEVAIISIGFTLGHITFGLFEERTPRWRKLLKYVLTLIIGLSISIYVSKIGHVYFFWHYVPGSDLYPLRVIAQKRHKWLDRRA